MPTKSNQASLCLLLLISIITSITAISPTVQATKSHGSNIATLELPPLSGYAIQYTSFAGTTYNLTAFDGLYCRYALPVSWTQPGALTPSQLRRLIDLTDIIYAQLAEITSGEPQGPGLLTIAVIPTGTQAGHAGSNFKGIELSDNELGSILQHLDSDLLSPELLHELIHNFEIFILQINLGYSDSVHAWTSFMIPFLQYYSRAGVIQSDADAWFQKKITEYTLPWDSTNATWAQCVRNGNKCPNILANSAWAGLLLRFAKLHGVNAVKRAFRFIRDYAATHPSTGPNPTGPQTPEEKNDLLVESLADGAQQNILCELDLWHWFATTEARARINERFPNSNAFCADNDHDGFSPLLGDTDDTDPEIKPTAIERLNSLDDDCDLVVDNLLTVEQMDFPSATQSAPIIPIPAKIRGQVTPSDSDTFIINDNDSLPRRLRINLQSPNTFVGFVQVQPVDLNGRTQSFSIAGGGAQILTLSRPGLWAITVQNSISATSDYTLSIENAGPQLSPVRLKVSPGSTPSTIQIVANVDTAAQTNGPTPNLIRFWFGSTGIAQTNQLQSQLSVIIPIPPGSGPFSLRAQLLKDDTPTTKFTIPLWIDRATGAMIEQNPDLSISADTFLPSQTQNGASSLYGFTITNTGPGLAENIQANIAIPSGLLPVSTATTLGTTQLNGNNFRLTITQLAAEEVVSFSVTTTNLNAQGTITTTATVTSTTTDPVQSNNSASITGVFVGSPSPTPTPTPTPTPSPTPDPNITLQSLPLKAADSPTRGVLSQGSLARVVLAIPSNPAVLDSYGRPDQNGLWPNTLAGFQVVIGNVPSNMIAVTRIPNSIPTTYAIDFLVPDQAATGNTIPVTITNSQLTSSWATTATIQPTAPAFWSINGTTSGPLLTLDADLLTAIDPNTPLPANNTRRLLLFASGIKTLVSQNTLSIRVTCDSGHQALLVYDYATTLSSLPGIQQIVIRIPTALAGCGRTQFSINDQQDSDVFLFIQ